MKSRRLFLYLGIATYGNRSLKSTASGFAEIFYLPIGSLRCYLPSRKIQLDADGYYSAESSHNQAMRFGDLPSWANEISSSIRENILFSSYFSESFDPVAIENHKEKSLFPPVLLWREPLFNQLIVNIYQPGEGITGHVDLMRFEDGIAIVSLESLCVMHFSPVGAEVDGIETHGVLSKIPVLLTPGSVVLMWGEARYVWKHEINRKAGFQIWEGKEIEQKRRTSVTLRRLCPS